MVGRGYGAAHRARRRLLEPFVRSGAVPCARCGELIRWGEAWDLGHDDVDRSRYSGPEHASRNRATSSHRAKLRAADVQQGGRVRRRRVPVAARPNLIHRA